MCVLDLLSISGKNDLKGRDQRQEKPVRKIYKTQLQSRQGKERRGVHEPEVQKGREVAAAAAAGGGAGPLQPTTLRGWTSLADSQKNPTLRSKNRNDCNHTAS